MIKLILILLIGLAFESTGVVLLKKGMSRIGEVKAVSAGEVARVIKAGAANPQILLGVFFEALFFACLLVLMPKSDISFLWPLTILQSQDKFTIVLAMSRLLSYTSSIQFQNVVMAGAVISILPNTILFLFLQRFFITGLAQSGLKG